MKKNYLIYILTIGLLFGCGSEKQTDEIKVISMNVDTRTIYDIDISDCDTLLLEETDKSLMYAINQLIFDEDKICVLGIDKISLFDYDGKYIMYIVLWLSQF